MSSFARVRIWRSAVFVWLRVAFISGRRARITISQPDAISPWRGTRAARIRRFARFRLTALPTDFPAATPTRVVLCWFGAAINTTSGWACDLPERRTRSKSDDLVKRNSRFTGARFNPRSGLSSRTFCAVKPGWFQDARCPHLPG